MRCPECGSEVSYGPFYNEAEGFPFDYKCDCGWEGDNAILAYAEDYGCDPFRDELGEVLNYLAVGTVEAYKTAVYEIKKVIERRGRDD